MDDRGFAVAPPPSRVIRYSNIVNLEAVRVPL